MQVCRLPVSLGFSLDTYLEVNELVGCDCTVHSHAVGAVANSQIELVAVEGAVVLFLVHLFLLVFG